MFWLWYRRYFQTVAACTNCLTFRSGSNKIEIFHRFIEKHVSQNYEIFELVKNVLVKMPLTKLARRYHSQRRPKQQGRVCKNWKCISFLIWKDVSCINDVENFICTHISFIIYKDYKLIIFSQKFLNNGDIEIFEIQIESKIFSSKAAWCTFQIIFW